MTNAESIVSMLLETARASDEQVVQALHKGPITAIGGIAYDVDMNPLVDTSDLYSIVRRLDQQNIFVRRIDAGGTPRWAIAQQTQ